MSEKERKETLRLIKLALKNFPKVVKRNEARGRSHRKLMKAFAPVTRALARKVNKKMESS